MVLEKLLTIDLPLIRNYIFITRMDNFNAENLMSMVNSMMSKISI